jgi:hypothetical protein
MELDKTSIVLRQRSLLDLIDLSLIVTRTYWKPICFFGVIGALPWALLNFWLLIPIRDYEVLIASSSEFYEEAPFRMRYVIYMISLILIEAPMAMLGVTYFLGQAVFFEHPTMRDFGKVLAKVWPAIVWALGIVRFGLLAAVITVWVGRLDETSIGFEIFVLGFLCGGFICLVRAIRPFASELIILEQLRLFRSKKSVAQSVSTYRERSSWLHQPITSELLGRYFVMGLAMVCLATSLTFGELFLSGIFLGSWRWGIWMDVVFFPLNVWIVALWCTVFRLLSYIDSRTRLEGWELELRMKAEAERLKGAAVAL